MTRRLRNVPEDDLKGQTVPVAVLSMDELCETLLRRIRNEATEALRVALVQTNGMAGLEWLRNNYVRSVSLYRETLSGASEAENSSPEAPDGFPVDCTVKIHAVTNLDELLSSMPANLVQQVGHTLMDLKDEAAKLRVSYSDKCRNNLDTCRKKLESLHDDVGDVNLRDWYALIENVKPCEREIVCEFEKLLGNGDYGDMIKHIGRISLSSIVRELQKLIEGRNDLYNRVMALDNKGEPTEAQIRQSGDCRQCRAGTGPTCAHCQVLPLFDKVERLLWKETAIVLPTEISIDENETAGIVGRGGPTGDSLTLELLNFVVKSGKQRSVPYAAQCQKHLQTIKNMKSEMLSLRKFWASSHLLLSAHDELAQACLRFQLGNDIDARSLCAHEIAPEINKLTVLRDEHWRIFKTLTAQLRYLANLNGQSQEQTQNNQCPICHEENVQFEIRFQSCMHMICGDCFETYVEKMHAKKCPQCRTSFQESDVVILNKNKESSTMLSDKSIETIDEKVKNIEIIGQWGSKVDAIVRLIKRVVEEEDAPKFVIFTSFELMTKIVAVALGRNSISYVCFEKATVSADSDLQNFLENPEILVCVASHHRAGKGLNMTEANHVIFLEPFLSVADELQAIGRVYRMGQVRQTYVHRMYIADTIEVRVREMSQITNDSKILTDEDAKVLLDIK
eukprot:GHVL01003990.1.p1 GENE.GHVL01003990.1~~GHVL01003990.1.p1  ORF type:complete len:678 (+),score=120.08 GHVL01003990.1:2387-4420(+)